VSTKPAPVTAVAPVAAASRSASARPCARSCSGRASTRISRTSPPNTFTRATPGTISRRGRTVHSPSARSSIGESTSDWRPILSTSIVADVSGESRGGATPAGRRAAMSARLSATSWRERYGSASSVNTAVTTESPWIDSERSASMPATPPSALSIGVVTSRSTCSGARPGASVCTTASGGAKSGNTSSGARRALQAP
jgi:hypothetical protein